jgi:hypothetical protein
MTRPEPFAAVHADDLLLDRLGARLQPTPDSTDPAAEALLRLARAADAAADDSAASRGPTTGIDSGATEPGQGGQVAPASARRQRHAVIASRLLVAAAASVALGLIPAAHDTRPTLPSPVLPAAPVALVRAQALVAQAQGLVAPVDAEPTAAGLDRAEALLAEASGVLDGVRDPVGGTLGVDAVRARMAGVAGALAAARHRLASPSGVVQPLPGTGSGTPVAPVAADRGRARGAGATAGATSRGRSSGADPRHRAAGDSRDGSAAGADADPARTPTGTSGSTDTPDTSQSAGTDRPAGPEHSDDGGADDRTESDDVKAGDTSGDGEVRSGTGSHDGADDGATGSGSGGDDGHEAD